MAASDVSGSEGPDSAMKMEVTRLETFKRLKWPDWAPVGCEKLAKAGFFYTGNSDEVECFSCGGRYSGWDYNDQAILIHREKYANCPFVLDQSASGNVPLTGRKLRASVRSSSATSLSSSQSPGNSVIRIPVPPPDVVSTGARPSPVVFRSERHFRLSRSMTREEDRLGTFRRWPKTTVVHPYQLARAGFFFTGRGDTVQCAFCRGRLQEWQSGDDPSREHRDHFPDCSFVRGSGEPVRPASSPPRESSGDEETSRVEVVVTSRASLSPSSADGGRKESSPSVRGHQMKEMGIVVHRPLHSHMSTYQARLQSYLGWPPEKKQRPQDLALAGFFYAGFSDNVKCFHCNGGLHNWDPNDSPFREHAKWFGGCDYLRLCRGDEYIQAVLSGKDVGKEEGGVVVSSEPGTVSDLMELGVNVNDEQILFALDMGYSQRLIVAAIIENGYRLFDTIGDLLDRMEGLRVSKNVEESMASTTEDAERMDSEETSGPQADCSADSVAAENRFLKEQRTCKICMDADVSVVILPCGHLCCCPTCAPALKHCPICRKEIRGFVRTYFS